MVSAHDSVVMVVATFVLGAVAASCAGSVPVGSSCSSSGECETGLSCLYALGSGCSAKGQCLVAASDCSGSTVGLSLCGCGGASVDLTCVPISAALSQRTATGAACGLDSGANVADATH
jgi:hypothetical protein